MKSKLSLKLFLVMFLGMGASLLAMFMILDNFLLSNYLNDYNERFDSMINEFSLELENTLESTSVEDSLVLVNRFALENHAKIVFEFDEIITNDEINYEYIPIDYETFDLEGIWDGIVETYSRKPSREEFANFRHTRNARNPYDFVTYMTHESGAVYVEDYFTETMFERVEEVITTEHVETRERVFDHLSGDETALQINELTLTNSYDNSAYRLSIESSISPVAHVITQVRSLMIPAAILGLSISGFIALILALYVTGPIKRLSNATERLGKLDFEARFTLKRRDELGLLTSRFSEMAKKLDTTVNELSRSNKKLGEEIEKDRFREKQRKDFFMAVSHELKTPLMMLKTHLSGMIDRIGMYENRDLYLSRSHDITDHMTELVNQILQVSQLNSSEMQLKLEKVDLGKLILENCRTYEKIAESKGIFFTHHCEKNLFESVDVTHFGKVITNILSNAVHYTDKGEVIDIQLHRKNEKTILTVENYGAQINELDLKHLFQPFYRADKSRNSHSGGSGMGLYLVKTILDLHGFRYSLSNSKNGVIFRIEFNV